MSYSPDQSMPAAVSPAPSRNIPPAASIFRSLRLV